MLGRLTQINADVFQEERANEWNSSLKLIIYFNRNLTQDVCLKAAVVFL